jgi:alpha-galactosidase
MSIRWADLDLKGPFEIRDLWKHIGLGKSESGFETAVAPHGTVMMIRISQ